MRNRPTPTSVSRPLTLIAAFRPLRPLTATSTSRALRVLTPAIAVSLFVLALTAPAALAAPLAQDAPGESNLGYLLAGTLLTWAGFFAYAVFLWRKNRDLRREVDDLRRTLAERE